ncbi:oxygenase MpaB family protein [Aquipuribacter nitratireducens]|uniref:Oxygenase MpaB family protein n=1 Tax=Aquipuribacter nitratireducens TaxID=650104 RepID=A0ABW0GLA7_9MICO
MVDGRLAVVAPAPGAQGAVPADPGLFGPTSVTWRVHADPLMAVGGLRALLLQSLHPEAAEGFAAHSRYRDEPWSRLVRTADFVALTTFGSTEQVLRAAAHVRRAHDRAASRDGGRRLDDPRLLLWVHCCLVDSMLHVVRRGGLRLDAAEADRYVAEQVRVAALLGVDPAHVPDDVAGLRGYLLDSRASLRLCPAAREAVAVVLAPPLPALLEYATPARAGWSSLVGTAFASLPGWARALFPAPWRAAAAVAPPAAVTSSLRALRLAGHGVQALVPALRGSPHEREARRRLGLAG